MLVLTRKLMERLFIGDDICVTVVRLESGQVRLGIDAPRDVSVVRAELVPDRPVPGPYLGRDPQRGRNGNVAAARPNADLRPSPYEARGTGSRPRGRSR